MFGRYPSVPSATHAGEKALQRLLAAVAVGLALTYVIQALR
jgi:hypothetical protein